MKVRFKLSQVLGFRRWAKRAAAFGLTLALSVQVFLPGAVLADHDPFNGVVQDKVDICHWAGNSFNDTPQVSVSAIINGGHGSHTFDIIPPFHYQGPGNPNNPPLSYPGLNWNDANAALWAQDCGDDTPDLPVDTCDAAANLVINGSFETPLIVHAAGWDIFEGDGSGVSPWTSEWIVPQNISSKIELQEDGTVAGVDGGHDGDQYTELDVDLNGPSGGDIGLEEASIRLSQTISTVPGGVYELSFWTHPRPGYDEDDNAMSVSFDGAEIDSITNDGSVNEWTLHTYEVMATTSSTVLTFADEGTPNTFGMLLDDVSLTAACGEISGLKFHDVDGDGIQAEDGEDGIEDWTIYLDLNGNGSHDDGEPTTLTDEDGLFTFENLFSGDYTVREEMENGWIQTTPGAPEYGFDVIVTGDEEEEIFVEFGNQQGVTITAHKVMCAAESDLPGWGDGGSDIDEDTAADFVADSDGACWMQPDWGFQWGIQSAGDPGDILVGATDMAGWSAPFTTDANGKAVAFISAQEVEGNSHLWFREVLQDGYMPFTHDQNGNTNTNDVSAEVYCHIDVLNYDNYDRIDGLAVGENYDCVGFNVELPKTDTCDALSEEDEGWYGRYYNYVATHPDMNLDGSLWPDNGHGDPMGGSWDTDWYAPQYFVESQVDSDLEFGENFFPLDFMGDDTGDHNYHFGVHWTGKVTAPADGVYNYTLTGDDDIWVYVDGALETDASGIHPPTTVNDSVFMTAGDHIVDIFFAERHMVQSHMSFFFEDQLPVMPWNDDCVGRGEPTLMVDKSGEFDGEGTITYTINWQVDGEGDLYDAYIMDVMPAGTTYVSDSASPVAMFDGGTETLTWDLGDLNVGESGFVTFEVTIDSAEEWADIAGAFDQGQRKDGSDVLFTRSIPDNALGEDDYTGGPVTFVSLGFGGSLVLEFTNYIIDGVGNDIEVYEATNGIYPDERIELFVSQDGADGSWVSLGTGTFGSEFDLDGSGLSWARYVKLVDISDPDLFPNDADGYDVDAVEAKNSMPAECTIDNVAQFAGYIANDEPHAEGELRLAEANTTTPINELACEPSGGTCELMIEGRVFNDLNGDTFFTDDPLESGLDGWTVYIDENDNNALDEGEPTATTVDGGFFSFLGLSEGEYTVRQVTPEGWSLIYPNEGPGDPDEFVVTLECPEDNDGLVELDIIGDFQIQAIFIDSGDANSLRFANAATGNNPGGGGSGGTTTPDDDDGTTAGDQITDDSGVVAGDQIGGPESLPVTGGSSQTGAAAASMVVLMVLAIALVLGEGVMKLVRVRA